MNCISNPRQNKEIGDGIRMQVPKSYYTVRIILSVSDHPFLFNFNLFFYGAQIKTNQSGEGQ